MASGEGKLPSNGFRLRRNGGTSVKDASHDGTILCVPPKAPIKVAPNTSTNEVPLQVTRDNAAPTQPYMINGPSFRSAKGAF